MKPTFQAFAGVVVLLAGCAGGPPRGPCDTTRSMGACAVTVQVQGSRLVVCPANDATSPPVCMNTTLDVQRGGRPQKMQIMLPPGRCQTLSSDITSAASNLCQAYAAAESSPRSE
jgi:hypothetical protein